MKQYWRRLADGIDARAPRERLLILLAAVVVVLGAWVALVFTPWEERSKALQAERQALQGEIVALQGEAAAILARAQQDPNRPLRLREAELGQRIQGAEAAIRERTGDFIPPERMGQLLQDLLRVQADLRLVRLETLTPEPIRFGNDQSAPASVFRHGLLLEFSGSYAATLDFLRALEAMSWQVFWDRLEYEVTAYPEARVILRLHTLSTREAAIGV
jgi:MSHA biogenesis protein MshJ